MSRASRSLLPIRTPAPPCRPTRSPSRYRTPRRQRAAVSHWRGGEAEGRRTCGREGGAMFLRQCVYLHLKVQRARQGRSGREEEGGQEGKEESEGVREWR
eukprot:2165481-Rhodomonas_salina.1